MSSARIFLTISFREPENCGASRKLNLINANKIKSQAHGTPCAPNVVSQKLAPIRLLGQIHVSAHRAHPAVRPYKI